MTPIRFHTEAQDGKREILDHVARHVGFDFLQSRFVDLAFIQGARSLGCQIDFPLGQKRVAIPHKQAASDVLAEDAAVLVRLVEMFAYAPRQVVLAAVSPDANNAVAAVPQFAVLEQDVDAVFGTCARSSRFKRGRRDNVS